MRTDDLADQALSNLVNQFARSMDFLRELVQNSIDAGTPRIEVRLDFDPPKGRARRGVLSVCVRDFGQGMDEAIVDGQLTRLFSSTKEGDLTKIGKFGIGFVSVFAIAPDLVRVVTGRHGESWELLFHTDRTFEKNRLDEVVSGTAVTVYKRMRATDAARFVGEARKTLRYWCEHATTPISFNDAIGRTEPEVSAATEPGSDPFAGFRSLSELKTGNRALATPVLRFDREGDPDANRSEAQGGGRFVGRRNRFEAEAEAERIDRAMALDGVAMQVTVEDADIVVVAGYGRQALYGFYSGGLTLHRSDKADSLGSYRKALGNVSFKVRSPRLEHTLTRDSVLRDDAWHEAMRAVKVAAGALRRKLELRIVEEAAAGSRLSIWHRLLERDIGAGRALETPGAKLFLDQDGKPRALGDFSGTGSLGASIIFAPETPSLAKNLGDRGWVMVRDESGTRALIKALRPGWRPVDAGELYVMPELTDIASLPTVERTLVEAAQRELEGAVDARIQIRAGEFGGKKHGAKEPLFVEGPAEGGIFMRPGSSWMPDALQAGWRRLSGLISARQFLLNINHPHFRLLADLAEGHPGLAATALTQALMVEEGWFSERSFEALRVGASAPWMETP